MSELVAAADPDELLILPRGKVRLHGLDFDLARRNVWKRFLARRILRRASGVMVHSISLQTHTPSDLESKTSKQSSISRFLAQNFRRHIETILLQQFRK
jgi:hypothetical protein